MKLKALMAMTALMAALGTPVQAFQEQNSGGSAPAKAAAPAGNGSSAADSATGAGLTDPAATGKKATSGTEVRLPGLGKVGELPNMDFGLELLYGATELEKPTTEQVDPEQQDDDLRIRGTIKHQF